MMTLKCCRRIARDLRTKYGDRFRILRADSGQSAIETVEQLKLRNEAIALFLVDQRMPQMNGVEFLEQALQIFPTAKRALLTAYADTDAAIRAINNIKRVGATTLSLEDVRRAVPAIFV